MDKPRLLDLFCGAGGAAMGYHRAGFDVTGVDIKPQPRFPFAFIQADALEYVAEHWHDYDVIHASPPCQGYSRMRHLPWLKDRQYPLLIDATRDALNETGALWVIENVMDAPLLNGIMLCGLMFEMRMYRHRKFESNILLIAPSHPRHTEVIGSGRMLGSRYSRASAGIAGILPDPCGHTAGVATKAAMLAMGIDWMTRDEMTQAIPPAYTEHIGRQLLAVLERSAA